MPWPFHVPELRSTQLLRIPASSVNAPAPHVFGALSPKPDAVARKIVPPNSRCIYIYIPRNPAVSLNADHIPRPRHLSSSKISRSENMASKTTILEHPSVGQIHGVQPQGQAHVEQYLGIQYATLENRFARGKLVETYKSPIQATKTG